MTARGGESIIYDTFNKPTRIAGASITDFYYGPDHELYKEVSGTKTTYKLAGGVYEVIVDGSTTTQKSYVDGVIMNNRVLIGSTQSANDTVYLHTDHLGSVEATTNALGQFVNRMSFGAWGERQKSDWKPGSPTETFSTTNGFTGHDQLDNHNLIHMGGRVYDPGLGRFLSADIYIQSPYNTQSYNRYSYTFNNPLSYTDPTGYHSGAFEYLMDRSYYQSTSWSWANTMSYINTTRWEGWRVVNPDGSRSGHMTWTDTSTANSVSASSILQTTTNSWGVGFGRIYNLESGIQQKCGSDAACAQQARIGNAEKFMIAATVPVGGEGFLLAKLAWEARTARAVADSLKTAKFWNKSVIFKGNKVFQRNDLIDPKKLDGRGRSNLERMQQGLAPLGPDGKPINLHHLIQRHNGAIAEMTQTFHQQNSKIIHINPNSIPSGIDRQVFNQWRSGYWASRANDF